MTIYPYLALIHKYHPQHEGITQIEYFDKNVNVDDCFEEIKKDEKVLWAKLIHHKTGKIIKEYDNKKLSQIYYVCITSDHKIFKQYAEKYIPVGNNNFFYRGINFSSIFSAYNFVLEKIKELHGLKDNDAICFIHEDVKILDDDFEDKIKECLNTQENIGVMGVYGTTLFTEYGGWWGADRKKYSRGHLIQGRDSSETYHLCDYGHGFFDDIVSVDGCMFILSGKFAKEYTFDETTYDGYHFYDVDTCFTALSKGYKVCVIDTLVEHRSWGNCNDPSWGAHHNKFLNKWKNKGIVFPVKAVDIFKSLTCV